MSEAEKDIGSNKEVNKTSKPVMNGAAINSNREYVK